jgi:dTMP kinase
MSGVSGAKEDRFEAEAIEFHNRVREGFHSIAALEPNRVHLVDGSKEIDSVHRSICDIIDRVLAKA